MSKFLRRNIKSAYIMLGNACNMNCKYCLQHSLVTHSITSKVNSDVIDFLCEIAYEKRDKGFPIMFFGGEPLLYFENIKEIVKRLNSKKYLNFDFRVITNGKAMNSEMVKFFNQNEFRVVVSYDGKNSIKTRRFDVFQDQHRKADILAIDNLCLSAVVSANAYPAEILSEFQKLSNEYFTIHGYHLSVNLDTIFDTGLPSKELLNFDFERLRNEVKNIIAEVNYEAKNGIYNPNHACQNAFVLNEVSKWDRLSSIECDNWFNSCRCTNGVNILNIDLNGNLYACHNTSQSIGSIYDSFPDYLSKVLNSDNTKDIKAMCSTCKARYWCWSCKMIDNSQKENAVCKIKKAFYEPFYEYVTNNGVT